MKICIAQINSTVGDINYNYNLITKAIKKASEKKSTLLITPELSLTGYPPEDLLFNDNFIAETNKKLLRLATINPQMIIIVGHPL